MKNLKHIIAIILVAAAVAFTARADDSQTAKPKPYPLDTCLVCGMKLGSMGDPYVFVHQGQEIKVCDKSEQAAFDKDPQKYLKKLADAEAKLNK
jgi:nitrous oxide reductase accessory protein NosL